MDTQKKYWFPAKKYGWGWSFPTCWQGWAVFVGYAAAQVLLFRLMPPAKSNTLFLAGVGVTTIVLIGACWLKGEPPGSGSAGQ